MGEALGETLPAAQILESEKHQRRETEHDEKELQYLVVNGRGETPSRM